MLSTVLIASIAVVVVVVENRARKAFNEPVHPPSQARVVPTDPEVITADRVTLETCVLSSPNPSCAARGVLGMLGTPGV